MSTYSIDWPTGTVDARGLMPGSSGQVGLTSFLGFGEGSDPTIINAGSGSAVGIITLTSNATQVIQQCNSRSAVPTSTYKTTTGATVSTKLLLPVNGVNYIAWRGDYRRCVYHSEGSTDSLGYNFTAVSNAISPALFFTEEFRGKEGIQRRFRRSREPFFFMADNSCCQHAKTGSGAFTLASRPKCFNDGLTWIEPSAWNFGPTDCDNSTFLCLLTSGPQNLFVTTTDAPTTSESVARVGSFQRFTGPLTPNQIPGNKLWLKADSLGLTDGSIVSNWNDSSAAGYNFVVSSGHEPIYKANIVNGLPVVRFDGTDDGMYGAGFTAFNLSQPFTVIVVGQASSGDIRFLQSASSTVGVFLSTSGFLTLYAGSALSDSINHFFGGFHCFSCIFNGASSVGIPDGTQSVSGNPGGNPFNGFINLGWDGNTVFSACDIAEILIYDHALAANELNSVQAYLSRRYGVGFAVPDGLISTSESATEAKTKNGLTTESLSTGLITVLDDSYSESHWKQDVPCGVNSEPQRGQTFTATGGNLGSAVFYISNPSGAVGNVYAKLYALTGTFGSTAVPTGSALAVSDPINVATLPTSDALTTFHFSGANQIALTPGANYGITVEATGVTASNLNVGRDDSTSTHPGNSYYQSSGLTWSSDGGPYDLCFYVYSTYGAPESVTRVLNALRSATDAPVTSESVGRTAQLNRTATDAPHTAESIIAGKSLVRSATDAPTTSENVTRTLQTSRTATDAPATSESISRIAALHRTATDAPTTSEAVTRIEGLSRSATDHPITSESITRVLVLFRTSTDAPTTGESVTRILLAQRSATDAPTTSESVTRILLAQRTATDAPSTSESATSSIVHGGKTGTATDAVSTSESATRAIITSRSATDAPSTLESVVRIVQSVRTATDAPTTSESVGRIGTFGRSAAESLTTSEFAGHGNIESRTATDAPLTSESVTRVANLTRTATDAPSTSESAGRVVSLHRTATDAPTTSESIASSKTLVRSVTDAPTTSESVSRILSITRTASEAVSTAESATKVTIQSRSATDAPATSESASRIAVLSRSATDSPATSESATATKVSGIARNANESLGTSENVTRTFVGSRSAADNPATSEAATRAVSASRSATDAPATSELVARILSAQRSVTDAPSTSELVTHGNIESRTATDAPSTAESATRVLLGNRGATDAPHTSEVVSRVLSSVRTASDASSTAEAISRIQSVQRSATDVPATSESVTRTAALVRSATDAPTTNDVATQNVVHGGLSRSATESLATSETAVRTIITNRSATEGLSTAENVTSAPFKARSATDHLTTSENVVRVVTAARSTSDNPSTSESVIRILFAHRSAADALTTSELVMALSGQTGFASDHPSIAEVATRVLNTVRLATDATTTAEALSRRLTLTRSAADHLLLSEAITSRVIGPTLFDYIIDFETGYVPTQSQVGADAAESLLVSVGTSGSLAASQAGSGLMVPSTSGNFAVDLAE